MPVAMELRRIIISEVDEHQVVILKEVDGDRSFPIVIGIFEATSINRRVKREQAPRPLTHDLIASVVELMGGDIQDIVVNELQEHTYFAKLRIRHNGELVEVDSRPSDAIALAVTAKVPIYVAEDVLGEVCGEQTTHTHAVAADQLENALGRHRCEPTTPSDLLGAHGMMRPAPMEPWSVP